MKCPYRKITYHNSNNDAEEYMECYGADCPFYVTMGTKGTKDYCDKAESETFDTYHRYLKNV